MTPKIGDIVEGKVVGAHADEISIALPDGTCGHLDRVPDPPASLTPGQELWVEVIGLDASGRPRLVEVGEVARTGLAFHEEVAQIRTSFSGSSVTLPQQAEDNEARVEWRLRRWLSDTESGLGRLVKRRGSRLSERAHTD